MAEGEQPHMLPIWDKVRGFCWFLLLLCFLNLGLTSVSNESSRSLYWDSIVIVFRVLLLIILFQGGMNNDGYL